MNKILIRILQYIAVIGGFSLCVALFIGFLLFCFNNPMVFVYGFWLILSIPIVIELCVIIEQARKGIFDDV